MTKISEAQKVVFEGLRKYPVLVHKNFTLFNAGGRGEAYFDIDRMTCNPRMRLALITLFKDMIFKFTENGMSYNKIVFIDKGSGPTGTIVLASHLSNELKDENDPLGKEIVILRLWKKLRFNHVKVKGLDWK